MDYGNDMRRCLQYIDEHILDEITPCFLAERFHYSFYHFCHVFRIYNDMSIGRYLRRRRMECGADDFCKGKNITEVALAYGFDTVSGFSKAFRREYGMSPSEYRRQKRAFPGFMLYNGKDGTIMKVEFVHMDAIKAVGYSIPYEGEQEFDFKEKGAFWEGKNFSSVSLEDYIRLSRGTAPEIGMWWHPEEESGELSYFFGPVVETFDFIPAGMVMTELPAGDYAVFTTEPVNLVKHKEDFAKEIKRLWKAIFNDWFGQSGYAYDQDRIAFEYYADENGGMDSSNAVMNIYVPIIKPIKN